MPKKLAHSSQERGPSEGEVGRVMFSFDGEPTDLKVIELHCRFDLKMVPTCDGGCGAQISLCVFKLGKAS